MRPDEFPRVLDLLPADLRQRAADLAGYTRATRCADCQRIGDAVRLALTAANYDEVACVGELLATAEQLADGHDVHPQPTGDVRQRGRGWITRWAAASAPLVAATDASWKGRAGGIGYVISDGRYGLRGRGTGRLDPTGASRVLVNELRAVDYLLTVDDDPPLGLTVLVDNLLAVRWLHRWQAGETDALPAGYSLRERRGAAEPTLVRLATLVSRRPDLVFAHVRGHSGHPLNEAADALSHMARRRQEESFALRPRAHDLVDAFLRAWHATADVQASRHAPVNG